MPEFIDTLFNLLAQFTGGRGGIDHVIVNYGIGAIFWGVLLWVALTKKREHLQPRENLLVWGFSFGLGRELLMLGMAMAVAFDLTSNEKMHVIFPPLEHALSNIAEIVVAAAFILFLTKNRVVTINYMKIGIFAIGLVYLATFLWWAQHITADPTSKFGQTWCDWAFRAVASMAMAWPIYYLWTNSAGKVRNVVCVALSFFFFSEFLKMPDMALGEAYEHLFTPIRHGLYIAAIPLFGYVYLREQSDELRQAFDLLETRVEERTEELEHALQRLQLEVEKQEQTAKELEAFSYSVAHDLKAPLRAMEGFSTALAEDYSGTLDNTAQKYIGHISNGASRMGTLIDDLLEYSRVGRDNIEFQDVALGDVLTQVQKNILGGNFNAVGKIKVADDLPIIRAHELTLELVFQNIISNAIKFCPLGREPEVCINWMDKDNGIEIDITDNGIGIAPEHQGKIFEIFQRLHTTESFEGTGIGLAIVQKGVQLHNGTITLESTPGVGTTFKIFLPNNNRS